MTAIEFMAQLDAALLGLGKDDRDNALEYYREYFEEAGENADAAAEALGSPQSVAERIIAEADGTAEPGLTAQQPQGYTDPGYGYSAETSYGYSTGYGYPENPYPSSGSSSPDGAHIFTLVIVLLLTLPLWITVYSLWLTLLITMAVLLVSFGIAALGAPILGIIQLVQGNPGAGLFEIGGGLFCGGLVLLLWKPFWLFGKFVTKGLFTLSKKIIFGLLGR